tara:strand:- start:200 stop:502 length:303 start_codon:yes stop_codon:yes gene_type:complete
MRIKKNENKPSKKIIGIIFIGGGSSWFQGDDEGKVAVQAAKICKADWKHLFKFEKNHVFPVNLFDASEGKHGWHCDMNMQVTCDQTDKPFPKIKTVYAAS